ncbi:radical SAM protein [Staphylococcus pseudintermedius]|nr:radical SAM protein [Staphylococcus pseudintermedius]
MRLSKAVKLIEYGELSLVCNTDNGLFASIDKNTEQFVKKLQTEKNLSTTELKDNEELITFFNEGDFFKKKKKITLEMAYIHVTNDCPLHCLGCYSEDGTRNKKINIPLEKLCKVTEELVQLGLKSLVISGGEPLLRKDIVDYVKYCKEILNIDYIVILTSGMYFNQKLSDELSKFIDEISISIDTFDNDLSFLRDKGIFKKVEKSIEIAKKSKFKNIRVLPTLHRKNYHLAKKYIDYAFEKKVGISFSLLTVPPNDTLRDWIPQYEDLIFLGKNTKALGEEVNIASESKIDINDFHINACEKCGIGETILSIASDGSVYPCHMTHIPELKLGNIFFNNMKDIFEKSKQTYSKYTVDNLNEGCKACDHKYLCGGGCRARAYMQKSNFKDRDPYCPMFKTFFNDFKEVASKYH